jgi:hypothetical protein
MGGGGALRPVFCFNEPIKMDTQRKGAFRGKNSKVFNN